MSDSLFVEFPPVSTEEWEVAVRADLKGRDPASLGKIQYRAEDLPSIEGVQPWPARAWQIWAEVSDLEGARRALARGAEGLVVANPTAEWLPVLDRVHLHTTAPEATLVGWAAGVSGTIEASASTLPHFRSAIPLPEGVGVIQQLTQVAETSGGSDWVVPVGPLYFEEIAKFRALRRVCPSARLIARTSRWHTTAYDPHVNLLRATTEAMSAIIGGCDALIVGPFTEARGTSDEFAERLALNTQLLLRDESYFAQVADPAAGSWYIEALTEDLLRRARAGEYDKPSTAFVGLNRYPNPKEAPPESVTTGRAMSALEQCRLRSDRAARRPTVRLIRGADEKMARARAAFAREFFVAGGFAIVESGEADLVVLCDADANYPVLASQVDFQCPVIAAGPDFNLNSDHAAVIAAWQERLGI